MQSEDGRLRIDNTSQHLFRETIRTFPILPEYAEIRLKAVGGLFASRIIPNTRVKIEHSAKGFVPHYDAFRFSPENVTELIRGGRVQDIEIEMRMGSAHEGFEQFKDCLLPTFINNRYELFWGDLWVSTYHLTGYNQGDYRESGLRFDAGWIHKGLELDLDPDMPVEEMKKLQDWFNQLCEKYK